ncbi:dTDP-4-dehydrorhamnose reductase [Sulfurimonas sp. MAG313]|nr:dTDP-4-dehydrorhamnose reductase [Sulfurimonas sp. MAG313]MDF1880898.1 dTDP-4-dehydrorhamnose reductase [Sulfurimonas sp. MAG313]
MKSILVTGANGQLGSEIQALSKAYSQYEFTFTNKDTLDLSNLCKLEDFFDSKSFDIIINCAAYTAVDKAEEDQDKAKILNHKSVNLLSKIAKNRDISLIHISTDYVFDGTSHIPYTEDMKTCPQSVYGQTKLDGENAIIEVNPKNSMIIRTSWVYSSYGNNFVKTMLRLGKERDSLGVIFDQVGTPTYARDLAQVILDAVPKLKNDSVEIYHYSNEGVCSWYDFSKAIFELSHVNCEVNAIETFQYPTPAKRPSYSILNKSKIKKEFEISVPYWKDSLKDCLKIMGEI